MIAFLKRPSPVAVWVKVDGKLEMRWIDRFSTVRLVHIKGTVVQ